MKLVGSLILSGGTYTASLTKQAIVDDISTIFLHSGSEGAAMTNIANYCWALFITQAGGNPTTIHQASAMASMISIANDEFLEQWR